MKIAARPVGQQDSDDIFQWRNDPVTRQMFHSTDPVPRSDHNAWFAHSLTSDARSMWLCFNLEDAFPSKLTLSDLDTNSSDAMVEELTIRHHNLLWA